jgi:hypothetical protein
MDRRRLEHTYAEGFLVILGQRYAEDDKELCLTDLLGVSAHEYL